MTFALLWLLACGTEGSQAPEPAPAAPAPREAEVPAPKADEGPCPRLAGYDGPFAAQRAVPLQRLARMPAEKLPLLRNEVFAQYGRRFETPAVRSHFEAQPWYQVCEAFTPDALSDVDRENVARIQDFEGDTTAELLKRGQFEGEGTVLALLDTTHAELGDGEGDLYGWERVTRRWAARGTWVITWEGPPTFGKGAREAMLWKLDVRKGRILASQSLNEGPRG